MHATKLNADGDPVKNSCGYEVKVFLINSDDDLHANAGAKLCPILATFCDVSSKEPILKHVHSWVLNCFCFINSL